MRNLRFAHLVHFFQVVPASASHWASTQSDAVTASASAPLAAQSSARPWSQPATNPTTRPAHSSRLVIQVFEQRRKESSLALLQCLCMRRPLKPSFLARALPHDGRAPLLPRRRRRFRRRAFSRPCADRPDTSSRRLPRRPRAEAGRGSGGVSGEAPIFFSTKIRLGCPPSVSPRGQMARSRV